jgi:hypothetical protein
MAMDILYNATNNFGFVNEAGFWVLSACLLLMIFTLKIFLKKNEKINLTSNKVEVFEGFINISCLDRLAKTNKSKINNK